MSLRHPWFSQTLKRKCPDDLLSSEGNSGFGGGGFGVVGTAYGTPTTDAYNIPQPNQTFDLNGRAAKRVRKFESRNLERGFAELSIQPTSPTSSSSPPAHVQQQPDDGVWNNFGVNVGESSNAARPDGSTGVPLLRSGPFEELPPPEVTDVQMSASTWYEPEKDRVVITSLDDDEYDGDDEGQQQRCTGTKPTTPESDFTISPAFLNAINRKLTQTVDAPVPPPTNKPESQALVLFRPLPPIIPPPTNDDLKDTPSQKDWMLDSLIQQPSSSPPSVPSPFCVQDLGQCLFVSNDDDDMEIEML